MDEEQGLASPIAGGLRGIRRSVSSSIFTGRAVPQQVQGDTISQNLISKNSLTLESVSGQLSGITQQVSSINNSLDAIKNNLQLSDTLERQRQAAKERREAILAEQGLREGKESDLEKRVQFALLTPVRRVSQVAKGILGRLSDAFLFIAGGWLINTTLTFLRLRSEGTVEEMKEFRNKLIANLLILGGIMVGVTVAFSKLLLLTGLFKKTLLSVISTGFIKKPFALLFAFIGMNLLKFKNMLRLGIVGLFQKGAQEGANAATQSGRDAKILSDAAVGTGAVTTTTAFFPNKVRQIQNIGRRIFGRPIVTQEMAAAADANAATRLGKSKIATTTSKTLNFGGKLLNTFTKLVYVAEGLFEFGDYKKRGNNNFQAFIGASTRGITKYLSFGAGMKAGGVIGGAIGGPPGALIGAILGGIGVSLFGVDEGAGNFVGGIADTATGAVPEGKMRLNDGTIVDDPSLQNNNVSGMSNDTNEDVVITPTSVDTALTGAMVVPFKGRDDGFEEKLSLKEDVEVINLPLQGNSTPQTAISGPSKVGAGKVPKFPTLDYANNYVVVAESIFNVSAV